MRDRGRWKKTREGEKERERERDREYEEKEKKANTVNCKERRKLGPGNQSLAWLHGPKDFFWGPMHSAGLARSNIEQEKVDEFVREQLA